MLVPALLLAAVTTVTKIGTGWYAAKRAGIGPRGRLRAGERWWPAASSPS